MGHCRQTVGQQGARPIGDRLTVPAPAVLPADSPAAADLVFAGTAAIEGQMQRAGGDGLTDPTKFFMKVGTASRQVHPFTFDEEGRFFLAPFNV